MINNLLITYENDDRLEEEDIENMCLVSAKDPDNIEERNLITIKTTTNINDFDVSKLDKTKKNLIVFDDCSSNRDQVIQTKFFQNGGHSKWACMYLSYSSFSSRRIKTITRKYCHFYFL